MGLFDSFFNSQPPESLIALREDHYKRCIGPLNQQLLHSTDIKPVHIDIYQFEPTKKRPYWTLITGGMSDKRQINPDECGKHQSTRAEILMYVSEPKMWMINALKDLAEMPYLKNTHLHWWHTVPNEGSMTGNPSLLSHFFFLPPYFEHHRLGELKVCGDRVDFLWMLPITGAERDYAEKNGSQALEARFEEAELSPVVDESRASVI